MTTSSQKLEESLGGVRIDLLRTVHALRSTLLFPEVTMPAPNPESNPMNFFAGAEREQSPPNNKEEAGQRAVDNRREDLDQIEDPNKRKEAETALRGLAEQVFGETDNYINKVKATQQGWYRILESLSEKNPLRSVGEKVLRTVQDHQDARIDKIVKNEGMKEARQADALLASAKDVAQSFKDRQQKSGPSKDLDRER
jgi:hypothetical protein